MIVEPYLNLDAKLKSIGAAKDVAEAGKIADECRSLLAAMEHPEVTLARAVMERQAREAQSGKSER